MKLTKKLLIATFALITVFAVPVPVKAADDVIYFNNYTDNPSGNATTMISGVAQVKNFQTNTFDMTKYKTASFGVYVGHLDACTASVSVSLCKEDGTVLATTGASGYNNINQTFNYTIDMSDYTGTGYFKATTNGYYYGSCFLYANITGGKAILSFVESPQITTNLTGITLTEGKDAIFQVQATFPSGNEINCQLPLLFFKNPEER